MSVESYQKRAIYSELSTASYQLQAIKSELSTASYQLRAINSKLSTARYQKQAIKSKLSTASYRQRANHSELSTASYQKQVINSKPWTVSYQEQAINSKLLHRRVTASNQLWGQKIIACFGTTYLTYNVSLLPIFFSRGYFYFPNSWNRIFRSLMISWLVSLIARFQIVDS